MATDRGSGGKEASSPHCLQVLAWRCGLLSMLCCAGGAAAVWHSVLLKSPVRCIALQCVRGAPSFLIDMQSFLRP